MYLRLSLTVVASVVAVCAEVEVKTQRIAGESAGASFGFKDVAGPVRGDRGEKAEFKVLRGQVDGNSGGAKVLNDGVLPTEEDAPRANFFFGGGPESGSVVVDLGEVLSVKAVNSYSWHPGVRAPQRYTLSGSTEEPKAGEATKLTRIASVNTAESGSESGGQHGVSITNSTGDLGKFRYLVFDIGPSEKSDAFGQTFYSEIDIIAAGDETKPAGAPERYQKVLLADNGKYELVLDTSDAPELREWAETTLAPVIIDWYPKIVALLPSEGFEAPKRVMIHFDPNMRGVAAASGTRIRGSAPWYRDNLKGEAVGSIVHELVHVVQSYGRNRNDPDATRTPGWIVEGIPDYIRWYMFEPTSKGAEITARNFERAKFDGNYRISANFLNWVVERHGQKVILELNQAARARRYKPELWQKWTGKTVEELGAEWKAEHAKRLGITEKAKD